jgi:hypothetical protein
MFINFDPACRRQALPNSWQAKRHSRLPSPEDLPAAGREGLCRVRINSRVSEFEMLCPLSPWEKGLGIEV